MPETFKEQLERIESMANRWRELSGTWDLSDNDMAALSALLDHYKGARAEIFAFADALTVIKGHLDPDDPNNYRADDPEGAMDTAFERARQALTWKQQ